MSVVKLEISRIPRAYGLTNTGVICYFNALLQSLHTCTSIHSQLHLLDDGNDIHREFKKFMQGACNNVALLQALCRKYPKFGHGQESAREALSLLLDEMPPIKYLFMHRYRCVILCDQCKQVSSVDKDVNMTLDLFDTNVVDASKILKYVTELDDYKCEHCHQVCKSTRDYYLKMTSEVLIITFNIYGKRVAPEFPSKLQLGNFAYMLTARIEHHGGLGGGHYFAQCIRHCGGKLGIVTCNDSQYRVDEGFERAPGTYMLFYQCGGEKS